MVDLVFLGDEHQFALPKVHTHPGRWSRMNIGDGRCDRVQESGTGMELLGNVMPRIQLLVETRPSPYGAGLVSMGQLPQRMSRMETKRTAPLGLTTPCRRYDTRRSRPIRVHVRAKTDPLRNASSTPVTTAEVFTPLIFRQRQNAGYIAYITVLFLR